MSGKTTTATEGMPEALRTFEEAARSENGKIEGQGVTPTAETMALPDDPDRKNEAATDVLRAGVKHDPKAATQVVQESKDPRIPD
jgi:hypothetical protein